MSSIDSDDDLDMASQDTEHSDGPTETETEIPTLLEPVGYSSSTCGYCSAPGERSKGKSSKSYGMVASQISPRVYQQLIDRGWRRSGDYVYHPDNANTCCPQLTIKLDAMAFKPDKKLRHALNRWKRFILDGERPGTPNDKDKKNDPQEGPVGEIDRPNRKQKQVQGNFDFLTELHSTESHIAGSSASHIFQLELVKAQATPETFELYDKYQQSVHGDQPGKNSMASFRRFLCSHPLGWQKIEYRDEMDTTHLPTHFGAYHQLYRIDGRLVAFSVIDILPGCVSSVYFVWDPDYAWASLGKLSAMREAALAREMQEAGVEGAGWLYMGFYIHSCAKMRYKGEYTPSYLLDPGTNVFHPLQHIRPILDASPRGYHPFAPTPSAKLISTTNASSTQTKRADGDWPDPPPPSFRNPKEVPKAEVQGLLVFIANRLMLLSHVPFNDKNTGRRLASELSAAVGPDMLATASTVERNVFLTF